MIESKVAGCTKPKRSYIRVYLGHTVIYVTYIRMHIRSCQFLDLSMQVRGVIHFPQINVVMGNYRVFLAEGAF